MSDSFEADRSSPPKPSAPDGRAPHELTSHGAAYLAGADRVLSAYRHETLPLCSPHRSGVGSGHPFWTRPRIVTLSVVIGWKNRTRRSAVLIERCPRGSSLPRTPRSDPRARKHNRRTTFALPSRRRCKTPGRPPRSSRRSLRSTSSGVLNLIARRQPGTLICFRPRQRLWRTDRHRPMRSR
jgi:hypothetical protein